MPHNKIASARYRLIDECLRKKGKAYRIKDLVAEISDKLHEEYDIENGVSERTLQSDINIMRKEPPIGFGAPIICDRKTGIYSYGDPNYSIYKMPLLPDEVNSLRAIVNLLKQHQGLPHLEILENIILKLESRDLLEEQSVPDVIYFEKYPTEGLHWLKTIYQAILNKNVLEINYSPYQEVPRIYCFHPYLLKEYRSRWYAVGYCEVEKQIRTLALDRIRHIEQLQHIRFIDTHHIKHDVFFKHTLGITVLADQNINTIRIKASASQKHYLRSRPIHHSQKLVEDTHQGPAIFEFQLIPNYEFRAEILRLGAEVEVLEPTAFRQEIQTIIADTLAKYSA